MLAQQARLVQAHHALALVAHARSSKICPRYRPPALCPEGDQRTPRQVMNCEPNRLTVGGGAFTARGFAAKGGNRQRVGQEEGGLHTLVSSSSRSSGVGAPVSGKMRCSSVTCANRP